MIDVVVNDSLGIAAELEREMQHVVGTYECEWNAAVSDPAPRGRFRHFLNSEQRDDLVTFVQERGQIRLATLEERASIVGRDFRTDRMAVTSCLQRWRMRWT